MEYDGLPDIRCQTALWDQLEWLRQQTLMNEGSFLTFARERGIAASGVGEGDPGEFFSRGWLACDGFDYDGQPLFHQFRLYPLHRILECCALRISQSASLRPESYIDFTRHCLDSIPSPADLGRRAMEWNRAVDLAVLLEPLYWPVIVGTQRWSLGASLSDIQAARRSFRSETREFVRSLDPGQWRQVHERLVLDAFWLDGNSALYVLLRVARWEQRKQLTGKVSGALWLRHIGEVLRRGFEEVFEERWVEEDSGSGHWFPGARERVYGAERPFDSVMRAKPFVAHEFGLFTGSTVRWYVEGKTEYYAFLTLLSEPSYFGVELVNLEGVISTRKGVAALTLEGMLREDRRLRRFSMLSLDADVTENLRFIRRQIVEGNLVGGVALHDPDFEFANFSVVELVDIAADLDEESIGQGDHLRKRRCSATNARDFETWYRTESPRAGTPLKGEAWGRALGRYALKHPQTADGVERRIIQEYRAAAFGWNTSYSHHERHFTLDPETFERIPRSRS